MKIEGPLRLPERELVLLEEWTRTDLPRRVAESRIGARPWVTYEGPPTVNGVPALHHVFTSTHKDIYARYQTMCGRYVDRRAGWDCQGLPVEINVERKLGLADKQAVLRYGVDRFVAECRGFVVDNIAAFEEIFKRIGFWVDFDRAYRTMDDDFIESVWWHVKQIFDAGELYEGHKVLPYCPRCGTALSSHELGQPGVYTDRVDASAYVAFELEDADASLVIWTTTPWTLPANVAVAVDPERQYGVFERHGRRLIVAADRAGDVFGVDLEPVELIAGRDLVDRRYRRPYELAADKGRVAIVIAFAEVDANTGSGLVHIAPAFGEVDAALGEREQLAVINPVDAAGRYTEAFPAHEGVPVLTASQVILGELEASGHLVGVHDHTHSYPHCWRCRQPLIYWAKPSWYIRTSAHRDELAAQNQRVDWHPETIKEGRFGNWLRGNVDWALSRDRFWGTPLPLWRCRDGHVTCIGSRAELAELAGLASDAVPTHRPEIDEVSFPCPQCAEKAERVSPVGDVWMDSGCVPGAQWGYPAHDREGFESQFPADFICEAIDQTRGWFYSLLAVNTLVYGETPFRHVVCLGLLVDDDGRKMSKSLGNVVDPVEAITRFGADGVRWYLLASGAPWSTRRVSFKTMQQRVSRDLDTFWNVAAFYVQYAELSDFDPSDADDAELTALDRWILSRTESLVRTVADALEDYSPHTATDAISAHLEILSNWYVRRSRPRFWDPETHGTAALRTLREVLLTLSHLIAPLCPFLADMVFRGMGGADVDSVHLSDWPKHRASLVSEELDASMEIVRRIAQTGRAARNASGLAVRQPLAEAVVSGVPQLPPELVELIADELNVKHVKFQDAAVANVRIEPNWRRLGPRFRDRMSRVAQALSEVPPATVAERVRAQHSVTIRLDGVEVELAPEDLVVSETSVEGWAAAEEAGITVALDTTLDEQLVAEGRARNLIRQVQLARRESGLHISDRIELFVAPEYLSQADVIAREVLARTVSPLTELPPEVLSRGESFAFSRSEMS